MEEKRRVSKSCFEAQRRSKNCGVIRRKRKSADIRLFPPPTSTLLPPHRFDLAVMRHTFVVIAAFRAIDRSFGTQYANNRRRRRGKRESGMWRAFPATWRGPRTQYSPFGWKRKRERGFRSYFLRGATPSIGKKG